MRLCEVKATDIATPTQHQKQVIARVLAAPNAKVAADSLNGNQNLIAARDMLMKLGLISLLNGEIQLTDQGMTVAQQENIVDMSGQLTPDGKALLYDEQQPTQEEESNSAYDLEGARQAPYDPASIAAAISPESGYGESFQLLKQLL